MIDNLGIYHLHDLHYYLLGSTVFTYVQDFTPTSVLRNIIASYQYSILTLLPQIK